MHDAFLLPEEVAAEAAFGHAAADYAIGLGRRAGARRVLLTHHKPDRTDDALDRLAARRRPAGTGRGHGGGAEGEIRLSSSASAPGRRRGRRRLRAERAGRGA